MPNQPPLDKVFTQAFGNQQEGHAVYPPVSTRKIKPGTCGYFDRSGDWVKIVQLTDAAEVKLLLGEKVQLVDSTVQPEDEDDITTDWSAKHSVHVRGYSINLDAKAVPLGAPAGASAGWEYECQSSSGAVILTPKRDSIVTSRLTNVHKVRDWMGIHIKDIVKSSDYKTIGNKGLWIITKTYAAPQRAVTVMTAEGQKASFHLAANVPQAAQAKASAAWWDSDQSSSGWIQSKAKKEGEGIILFIQGIWWRPGGFIEKSWVLEEEKNNQHLGAGDEKDPIYIDLPVEEDGSTKEENETLLMLYAEGVGNGHDLRKLPVCKDSYTVYENDGA